MPRCIVVKNRDLAQYLALSLCTSARGQDSKSKRHKNTHLWTVLLTAYSLYNKWCVAIMMGVKGDVLNEACNASRFPPFLSCFRAIFYLQMTSALWNSQMISFTAEWG